MAYEWGTIRIENKTIINRVTNTIDQLNNRLIINLEMQSIKTNNHSLKKPVVPDDK
jgi:hypothetical protein